MFFGSHVVIVEGDTEFAAFTEIMNSDMAKFPLERRPLLVRARGKATIPTLVKMMAHFRVDMAVLHDVDSPKTSCGTKRNSAYSINTSISHAVTEARKNGIKVIHRVSCPDFERQHGMEPSESEKPFKIWQAVRSRESIKESINNIIDQLYANPNTDNGDHSDDGRNFETVLREWVYVNKILDPAFTFDD